MQRRDYLALVGAAAATAGCPRPGGGDGGLGGGLGGGSIPDYADWLGEPDAGVVSDAYGFFSVDLAPLVSGEETETPTATPTATATDSGPRDALVTNPAVGLLAVAFLGFGMAGAGLSRLVAFGEAESTTTCPSSG